MAFPNSLYYYFFSIASNSILALLVLLRGSGKKIKKSFFYAVTATNVWLVSLLLYYNIGSKKAVLWLGRINFATLFPILYYILKLVIIFPRKTTSISQKTKIGLRIWFLLMTIITLFTPLVAKEELVLSTTQRETVYGVLYPLYTAHYLLFIPLIIGLLVYKIKRVKNKTEEAQTKYVLAGLSLSILFVFLTNIIFPYFGFFDVANYGVFAPLLFVLFVSIAIVKHHLFEIRVVLVEILVGVIAVVLLIQALATKTLESRITNWGMFILFCIFGYQLIKSTLREIKRRKEKERIAQELREAYVRLEKLDQAKTEFISIASHQLRTPLTAIKGYLSLIKEKVYGEVPENMKKPLHNVYISSERLIKLVNDLLNISRIEAGKVKAEIEKTSVEDIIDSVVEELESLAKNKENFEVIWEKPESPLPKVPIDKEKIRQVILNLIDNAIRYTKEGRITIQCETDQDVFRMKVADTGPGMSKDDLDNIFQSFTRGKTGQTSWTGGSGLGLYIAKKYVDMHHGRIWAESPGRGKGSTFYLELPLKR